MFQNLVFQQHLQPICQLQFMEEPPISLFTFCYYLIYRLFVTPDHADTLEE